MWQGTDPQAGLLPQAGRPWLLRRQSSIWLRGAAAQSEAAWRVVTFLGSGHPPKVLLFVPQYENLEKC